MRFSLSIRSSFFALGRSSPGRLPLRMALWLVVVPTATAIVLMVLFLVAVRRIVYCLVGVVLMISAVESERYDDWFRLAFALPFFFGGVIDEIGRKVICRVQRH
jgi:hypothetical protein